MKWLARQGQIFPAALWRVDGVEGEGRDRKSRCRLSHSTIRAR